MGLREENRQVEWARVIAQETATAKQEGVRSQLLIEVLERALRSAKPDTTAAEELAGELIEVRQQLTTMKTKRTTRAPLRVSKSLSGKASAGAAVPSLRLLVAIKGADKDGDWPQRRCRHAHP